MSDSKRPEAVQCSVCGEMIEYYFDPRIDEWVFPGTGHGGSDGVMSWMHDRKYGQCQIYSRIKAIEHRLDALESGGVVVDFTV